MKSVAYLVCLVVVSLVMGTLVAGCMSPADTLVTPPQDNGYYDADLNGAASQGRTVE